MAGISSRALNGVSENKFKYNGKEEQQGEFTDESGLEWLDYGARMYDMQIGRFFTQDRFTEIFYEFNPYHYCANNPLKNIDLNGDIFITTTLYAEEKNKNVLSRFDKAIEKGLGGHYKVERNAESGEISLKVTDKKGKMSKEQTAFYNILSGVINSETEYEMNIADGSSKVETGSWGGIGPGTIDIADIEEHPTDGPATAQGAIAHEVFENKLRVDGGKYDAKAYLKAHESAIAKAENPVNGSVRIDKALPTSNYSRSEKGVITGNYDELYIRGGIKYVVSTVYSNGNVTKVLVTPMVEKNKN